jgi:hypothetical protein
MTETRPTAPRADLPAPRADAPAVVVARVADRKRDLPRDRAT